MSPVYLSPGVYIEEVERGSKPLAISPGIRENLARQGVQGRLEKGDVIGIKFV